jgi:putative phosphoesterase
MRIGVISDTHGLLRPEAVRALRGVERIIHAGDIGAPEVLEALRAIAPVTAVRGNNDRGAWARGLPETETLTVAGARIHVIHDVKELAIDPAKSGITMVIAGHSHQPKVETRDGVTFLNPGSAGPRRFTLPVTIARVDVSRGRTRARLVHLAVAPPKSHARGAIIAATRRT